MRSGEVRGPSSFAFASFASVADWRLRVATAFLPSRMCRTASAITKAVTTSAQPLLAQATSAALARHLCEGLKPRSSTSLPRACKIIPCVHKIRDASRVCHTHRAYPAQVEKSLQLARLDAVRALRWKSNSPLRWAPAGCGRGGGHGCGASARPTRYRRCRRQQRASLTLACSHARRRLRRLRSLRLRWHMSQQDGNGGDALSALTTERAGKI